MPYIPTGVLQESCWTCLSLELLNIQCVCTESFGRTAPENEQEGWYH